MFQLFYSSYVAVKEVGGERIEVKPSLSDAKIDTWLNLSK